MDNLWIASDVRTLKKSLGVSFDRIEIGIFLRRDVTTGFIHLAPVKVHKPIFFDLWLILGINAE